jgi:RNA polymerase sigma factor (sigma-70 family)
MARRGKQEPDAVVDQPRGWDEFAPLYDEHHQRLYRVALLLCHGNPQQAEDATAETFIKVYKAWSAGGIDNFFGYARQTLVNHVLGQYRRDQVAKRHLGTQAGDLRGERQTEDTVVDGATTFALLEELPPRQRAAIVLRFYEDLPYEQIASSLGVTVGTVKAQVSTGLQRLRSLMEAAS